jgi:hypothetical protein
MRMPAQKATGAGGVSIGSPMRRRTLNAQSRNHVRATSTPEIVAHGFDMRRLATVALTVAAALGALLLAVWLDATATPPVI